MPSHPRDTLTFVPNARKRLATAANLRQLGLSWLSRPLTVTQVSRLQIRPISVAENNAMRQIIVSALDEFGCTGVGFSAKDPEMSNLAAAYQQEKWGYWVAVETPDHQAPQVLGGVGIYPLKGAERHCGIAEFHKFYLSPMARGKGVGKSLFQAALSGAKAMGYHTLYLETHPAMTAAIAMYEKLGFKRLTERLGDTGHTGFTIFMALAL
ncbi:MAG: GNAT family N-acetyltransferase [Vampirovibrionales bacterium]|nr:GNAT family N-acetyltransferase [Vampirovibrionales bacterium]